MSISRPVACAAALACVVTAVTATSGTTAASAGSARTFHLTVMGTTDLHGNVENWDYYKNAEYDDSAHNDIGVAKVSTLVSRVRAEKGQASTLLVDAGDTIQGTPLAYYYAKVDPITNGRNVHPMAKAMNLLDYDAAALGNHEFNYGIGVLRKFQSQLDFPLLGANAVNDETGKPAFPPYVIKSVNVPGQKPVKVGILGLTNPGIAIWDKHNVEGRLRFPGIVEQAKIYVPRLKAAGADVVVVSAHSGADGSSSYGDGLPYVENASTQLAERVPGVDAVLVGHAHVEIPQKLVTNQVTGEQVVLSEPLKWGERLSVFDLGLQNVRGRWQVASSAAKVLNANAVPEDPRVVDALRPQHEEVVDYVNTPVGTSTQAMSAAQARYKDVPALDIVNRVQEDAVKAAVAGTPDADLPVLSIAAPFNRDAAIPAGSVSIRDVAGLYIYDNTLYGVRMTGEQLTDYLEFSAKYFKQTAPGVAVTPDDVTNAGTPPTPDYNYDVVSGLDYDIDISKPVGQRIVGLTHDGAPVSGKTFLVAINNYRQSGGGGFPAVKTAPVVVNQQQEVRQLIIDWVSAKGTIDPSQFASVDWRLVREGTPVFD